MHNEDMTHELQNTQHKAKQGRLFDSAGDYFDTDRDGICCGNLWGSEMSDDQKTDLRRLMAQVPASLVSKMCRSTKKDNQKGPCKICGGWHGLPAITLDYVGHAAVTKILLDVDPLWDWEFVATDEVGLPVLDKDGGLWIKLTVCGKTRLGYGDAQGKSGPDAMKERIGDAIRNAAMRFGVALDLWSKVDLHANKQDESDDKQPVPESQQKQYAALDKRLDACMTDEAIDALTKVVQSECEQADDDKAWTYYRTARKYHRARVAKLAEAAQ